MPPIDVLKIKEGVNKLASMTPEQQLAFKKEAERQAINRADELLKQTQEENSKRVTDLKKQNRNRNLWIAGGMVVGAVLIQNGCPLAFTINLYVIPLTNVTCMFEPI